jgi:hypothetical protein
MDKGASWKIGPESSFLSPRVVFGHVCVPVVGAGSVIHVAGVDVGHGGGGGGQAVRDGGDVALHVPETVRRGRRRPVRSARIATAQLRRRRRRVQSTRGRRGAVHAGQRVRSQLGGRLVRRRRLLERAQLRQRSERTQKKNAILALIFSLSIPLYIHE